MKTLTIQRDEKKTRATVECAGTEVSVHRNCGYCVHCRGIRVGPRVYPTPQELVMQKSFSDEALMNAAMQFNTLVKDGTAIECDDDQNTGFKSRYRR